MTDYSKDIERYLNGEMTPAERHALEKKSLSDPFLAEALEGAEQINAAEFEQDIKALYENINSKTKKNNTVLVWSLRIAAGLIILFIATYLIINLGEEITSVPKLSDSQQLQKATPNELKTDTATSEKSNNQLALVEDKREEEKEEKSRLKDIERKKNLTVTPVVEAEKAAAPMADVPKAEVQTEENKTELTPPVVSSAAEIQEKKTDPVAVSEASKEAESSIPVGVRGASTTEKAKRSLADQSPNAPLPASPIRGVVTSAQDGTPLPGVNVTLKGTTVGTITDVEGRFILDSATLASTLVYSFIGLKTKEVNVTNFNPLNVALDPDVTQLSEVVVTGYGYNDRNETTPTVDLAHPAIGSRAYRKYLEENLVYPPSALDNKTEGRVTVEFFVETDGSLSNFTVVKGIGNGCDEELIRLIRQGPAWVATKKDNQAIRDKARVRLNFQIPGK